MLLPFAHFAFMKYIYTSVKAGFLNFLGEGYSKNDIATRGTLLCKVYMYQMVWNTLGIKGFQDYNQCKAVFP